MATWMLFLANVLIKCAEFPVREIPFSCGCGNGVSGNMSARRAQILLS